MDDVVTISRRYCGPPDSANGGYACGILAKRVQRDAQVRLIAPPPLDVALSVKPSAASGFEMVNGAQLIAEGHAAQIEGKVAAPVSFDAAARAVDAFRWHTGHPFPTCFVCGPQRRRGDGLGIFPGRVANRDVVASPWIPNASVCDDAAEVHLEVVWAVLDCPSWFGLLEFERDATFGLLGQLTARTIRRPKVGEPCVVMGWSRGREGRKLFGAAALYTRDGELLGSSEAIWIEPKTVPISSP